MHILHACTPGVCCVIRAVHERVHVWGVHSSDQAGYGDNWCNMLPKTHIPTHYPHPYPHPIPTQSSTHNTQ